MNEQTESIEQSMDSRQVKRNDGGIITASPYPEARTTSTIAPQGGTCGCAGAAGLSPNGSGMVPYVYAIGRVEARFPNLAVEK